MKLTKAKNAVPRHLASCLLLVSTSAVALSLTGCVDSSNQSSYEQTESEPARKNVFEEKNGKYVLAEMVPLEGYSPGTILFALRDSNGQERILENEELQILIAEEEKLVAAGTSTLTTPTQEANVNAGGDSGLSFGGAIVASMIGSTAGGMLSNSLSQNLNNNDDFRRRQSSFVGGAATSYASRTGYSPRYTGNQTLTNRVNTARSTSSVFRQRQAAAKQKAAKAAASRSKAKSYFRSSTGRSSSRGG